MNRISLWWRAVRPFSFTVSVIPPILGGLIATMENPGMNFNWFYLALTLLGCVIAHAGANLLSDYYDFKARVDREGTLGSSGVLVEKLMEPKQIFWGAWISFLVSGLIGLYFILVIPQGYYLILLILVGGILGVFYTAGPLYLKYRAMGDIAVFVSFGSAMTLGAYFVQAHHFSWGPVLYALPIALLVDAILHGNNLRDIRNDSAVNIKTLPIVVGEKGAIQIYKVLVFGAYVLTILLIVTAELPWVTMITFASFPLAWRLVKLVNDKNKVTEKKFSMIDAATAQLHSAFGGLLIVALLIHLLIFQ